LEIVLLSFILADKLYLQNVSHHLEFVTSDSTIEQFNLENMGVAVGILFLASLEAEIPLVGSFTPPPHFNTNVTKITFNI